MKNTYGITKQGFSRITAELNLTAKKPSKGTLNKAYQAIQSFVEESGYSLLEELSNVKGPSYGSQGDLLSSGGEFELETEDPSVMVNGIINEDSIEIYLVSNESDVIAESVIPF